MENELIGRRPARRALAAAMFVLIHATVACAQPTWTDDTANRLLPMLPQLLEYTNAVDVADVDNDGDLDILFANGAGAEMLAGSPQRQRLYINDGAGVLTESSDARLASLTAYCRDMDLGDVDGDDDLDIVLANTWNMPPQLLINDGMGTFVDQTATLFPSPSVLLSSEEVSLADVDNDGDLDAFFCNGTIGLMAAPAQSRLFINKLDEPEGRFVDETELRLPALLAIAAVDVDWADIDGDLDLDAIVGHSGSTCRLYRNDGTGVFTNVTSGNIPSSGSTSAIAVGDIDGDSDLDIVLADGGPSFADQVFSNNGMGTFTNISTTALPANPSQADDTDLAMYDYDNDGDLDYVIARLGGVERLYSNMATMTAAVVFTQVTAPAPFSIISDQTRDLAFGDLDNDGKLDLVTGQADGASTGALNRIFMNIGAGGAVDSLPPLIAAFTELTDGAAPDDPGGWRVRAAVRDAITGDNGAFFDSIFLHWTNLTTLASGDEPMKWSGGDHYRAVLPAQPFGTIEYQILATDRELNFAESDVRTFNVTESPTPPSIVSSSPADGTIDVLQDRDALGTLQGIAALAITFSEPVVDADSGGPLTAVSFAVELTPSPNLPGLTPPVIVGVTPNGETAYDLTFDRPITPGAWTTIRALVEDTGGVPIDPVADSVDLGFLPGDANFSRLANTQDLLAAVNGLNACAMAGTCSSPEVLAQFDMNRNGTANTQDLLRLIQLLNGVLTQNVWNGVSLPAQP